jgi:hypothetical protein
MLWSHNAAKSAGIAVDEVKLGKWSEWAAGKSLSMRGYFTLSEASFGQLRADGVPEAVLAQLRTVLGKKFATESEFVAAVDRSELRHKPFDHIYMEGVFDPESYAELLAAMPDHDLWMAFIRDPDGHLIGIMMEAPKGYRPQA